MMDSTQAAFADLLTLAGFRQRSTPLVGMCFEREGWTVYTRSDGYFFVSFPDGHSGDCRAGSTTDPVKALRRVLLAYGLTGTKVPVPA